MRTQRSSIWELIKKIEEDGKANKQRKTAKNPCMHSKQVASNVGVLRECICNSVVNIIHNLTT